MEWIPAKVWRAIALLAVLGVAWYVLARAVVHVLGGRVPARALGWLWATVGFGWITAYVVLGVGVCAVVHAGCHGRSRQQRRGTRLCLAALAVVAALLPAWLALGTPNAR